MSIAYVITRLKLGQVSVSEALEIVERECDIVGKREMAATVCYACAEAETPILTDDLKWIPACEAAVGQRLTTFDNV